MRHWHYPDIGTYLATWSAYLNAEEGRVLAFLTFPNLSATDLIMAEYATDYIAVTRYDILTLQEAASYLTPTVQLW